MSRTTAFWIGIALLAAVPVGGVVAALALIASQTLGALAWLVASLAALVLAVRLIAPGRPERTPVAASARHPD